jgi:hypothetical protein
VHDTRDHARGPFAEQRLPVWVAAGREAQADAEHDQTDPEPERGGVAGAEEEGGDPQQARGVDQDVEGDLGGVLPRPRCSARRDRILRCGAADPGCTPGPSA